MTANYTCQCRHPELQTVGCWIYEGANHRAGTTLSPVFTDLGQLFEWMHQNGWETFGTWQCRQPNPQPA